jgi:hypothetical protein
MASEEATMASAAQTSFANQVLRGVGRNHNAELLSKVGEIKPEHIREVMTKYLVPLFQPSTSNLVVTCAQIMAESVVANFTTAGFAPESKPLEFFQDDYGLKAPEGGDDDDDDDDDEEDEEGDDDDEENDEEDYEMVDGDPEK